MKLNYTSLLFLIVCSVSLVSCHTLQPVKSKSGIEKRPKEEMMKEAWEFEWLRTKDPALNEIPMDRLKIAYDYALTVREKAKKTRTAISSVNWQERGPNNVGGRTRSVIYDRNDPTLKTVWAGSVGGGLWKSTDITATNPNWTKVNDFFDNIAITTIAQHPKNFDTLYFGTGEGWGNGDAIRGLGIWRSINGGVNWSQLASTNNSDFYYVQKIIIDSTGNVYAATKNNGLMKSTDHGNTWTKVLGDLVGHTNNRCADIEMAGDKDIYVSFGMGNAGAIFKSDFATHGANTGNVGNWTDITPSGTFLRIELSVAPSDPNRIYALCENGLGGTPLIRRSTTGGLAWINCASAGFCDQGTFNNDFTRNQDWYDLISAVDPNNPDIIYIGGVDGLKSTDAGATWNQITSWTGGASGACSAPNVFVHADHHAIMFKPGSSTEILWGTDGGVFRTTNAGVSFVERNQGYNVTQYYACALHPTQESFFLAGAQDNGTHRLTQSGIGNGVSVTGGDGAYCHINQTNPNIQVTSYIYSNYFYSNDGGNSFNSMAGNSGSGNFINATAFDHQNNRMYGTFTNGNYELITNVGTTNNRSTKSISSVIGNRRVSTIKINPINSNTVWMGSNRSDSSLKVLKINNASGTISAINKSNGLPTTNGLFVSNIDIQSNDTNHLILCISNYGANSIWESTDGGDNWNSVEGNLPDLPVRCVMFHPDSSDMAFIGTDLGVWSTTNLNGASTDWTQTNSGLANTRVEQFKYREWDHVLLAATHGRGLFTTVIPHTPRINFNPGILQVKEETQNMLNCRGYKDYTVNLKCTYPPVGTVNTTVQVALGNAVAGSDYQYTTNGSFTTPSTAAVFNAGTLNVPVVIRIFDDNQYEPVIDSVRLNVVINSGNALLGDVNTCTVRISDNHDDPLLTRKTIWSENFESGINPPASWTYAQSNTNRWGNKNFVCASGINNYTMQIFNNATNSCGYDNGATSNAVVYRLVNANNFVNLETDFDWIGEAELGYDWAELVYSTNTVTPSWTVVPGSPEMVNANTVQHASVTLPASLNNTSFLLGWRWVNDAAVGITGIGIDNIVVSGDTARNIENTLYSQQQYLGPNEDIYFYHPDGDILARIENFSAHDYGCTTLETDRAGASAQFLPGETNVLKKIFDKAYRAVPANNNTNGNYRITLYVTTAEKNGFEAQGRTWTNDAFLFKTANSITLANSTTPRQYATNIVKNNFLNGYSITGEFNTGFSGFGIGNPGALSALPLQLISFTATTQDAAHLLQWETANETDVDYFDIERSENGVDFFKVGDHAAKNQIKNQYQFTDIQAKANQTASIYYRLKMMDRDGKFVYSWVIEVKNDINGELSLYPNPVTDLLQIKAQEDMHISLLDVQGKVIRRQFITAGIHSMNVNGLSAGVYFIRNDKKESLYKFEKK
ncbi:MAG: T9SS type A sorting domain-containing protein [Chitinophagaceae bacterium]|nr:T9SS type A sorting domain-containing protein [Chitinophagaceae bacterium]